MGLTESLDGLKFGQKIYFEDVGVGGSSRKGKGQARRCVVEGCRVDLSDAKGYYSRHRVCSMHSKTPKVIVAGLEQRFCQQCSRFHVLAEFDQGKRSCRRRLAGHNERRRKPPLFSSLYANSSRAGSFVMDLSAYPNPRLGLSYQNNVIVTATTGPYHHIFPPGECYTDSTRALSLLSNQHNRTSGMNNLMNTGGVLVAMSQTTAVNHSAKAPWGLNGVLPDMGTGQNHFSAAR